MNRNPNLSFQKQEAEQKLNDVQTRAEEVEEEALSSIIDQLWTENGRIEEYENKCKSELERAEALRDVLRTMLDE
jgi:hypothetical protein